MSPRAKARADSEAAGVAATAVYPRPKPAVSDRFDGVKDWLIDALPQPDPMGPNESKEDSDYYQLLHDTLARAGQVPLR